MSEQDIAGRIVDVFRLAAEGGVLEGRSPVALFGRLADQLAGNDGELWWQLSGSTDAEGKPRLDLSVDGRLALRCWRCLDALDWNLAVESVLLPVRAGQALPEDELENDEVDAVEVGVDGGVDVLSLVEDEIILALPMAPQHTDCGAPFPEEPDGSREESPFAALAGLRTGKGFGK